MKITSLLSAAVVVTALVATSVSAQENAAPVVSCPDPLVLECGRGGYTNAWLTARVVDAEADALAYQWWVNGRKVREGRTRAGRGTNILQLARFFRLGTNTVQLLVTDGHNPAGCERTVVVRDTVAPTVRRLWAAPAILWPANGRMLSVRVHAITTDACGPVTCRIKSVSSSETAEDGTSPDYAVTGNLSLMLRAERNGAGRGRIYTIEVECKDPSGNASTGKAYVVVPNLQREGSELLIRAAASGNPGNPGTNPGSGTTSNNYSGLTIDFYDFFSITNVIYIDGYPIYPPCTTNRALLTNRVVAPHP